MSSSLPGVEKIEGIRFKAEVCGAPPHTFFSPLPACVGGGCEHHLVNPHSPACQRSRHFDGVIIQSTLQSAFPKEITRMALPQRLNFVSVAPPPPAAA